ncbi:MAG: MBL fold metallo-hydrolase [Thiohalobacteraceae bacterium]
MPLEEPEYRPPANDEFEVSIFGSGIGECLIVHLGDQQWMVVDSCLSRTLDQSIATEYLAALGLAPENAVKWIVLTHWHDDHVKGAADLVSRCPAAKIYHSAAHHLDEYVALTETLSPTGFTVDRNTSGIVELAKILRVLADRGRRDKNYVLDKFAPAIVGREITSHTASGLRVHAKALSPGDVEFNKALIALRALIPREGQPRAVLPRPKRNHTAVAVWIEFGGHAALLGSDLEEEGSEYTGWSVILRDHRPQMKAKVFKVPHHGSVTGHKDEVWDELLVPKAVAVTTGYSRSGLPTPDDVIRVKQRTDLFGCTTRPSSCPKRDPAVERTMRETVISRQVLTGAMGHLQIRYALNGVMSLRGNRYSTLL